MSSVIDQQRELVPCNFIIDDEFISKKIEWHCAYMVDVAASDRTIQRKKELIDSSMAALTKFCTQVELSLPIAFLLAIKISQAVSQMQIIHSKPKPKYELGGPIGGVAIIGEGEPILAHDRTRFILQQHLKQL